MSAPGPARPTLRDLVLAWLPAAAYMAIIWTVSSFETPSFPVSLFPMRDKGVHVVEYGVLGFLFAHACLRTFPRHPRVRVALFSMLAGLLWGVLDEIHQAFVPDRTADLLDIVADSIGVTLGTITSLLAHHLRTRLRPQETTSS
jgi:VanZ family protein